MGHDSDAHGSYTQLGFTVNFRLSATIGTGQNINNRRRQWVKSFRNTEIRFDDFDSRKAEFHQISTWRIIENSLRKQYDFHAFYLTDTDATNRSEKSILYGIRLCIRHR